MSTHANCSHPATRSARATCRRERAKGEAQAAAKASSTKPKAPARLSVVLPDGRRVTPTERTALRNIERGGYPSVDSNDACRGIREKGLATFNRTHNEWQLTDDGRAIVRMQ